MIRCYLSGPMRGYALLNAPAFNDAAAKLRALGYEVVNPVEISEHMGSASDDDYLIADLEAMRYCDAIVLLPGWLNSKGCAVEIAFANYRGMNILQIEDVLKEAA